jgi:hypothetical protein
MTITLDGTTLSSNLVWRGEFDSPAAAQSVQVTIGGRTVVQQASLDGGRTVVLEATDLGDKYKGVFTRAQVQAIKALEASGAAVALVYGSQTLQVVVAAGGVQVYPLIDSNEPGADDEYLGTITLIEV